MKLSISMTRREFLLGWSYWLISLFGLPFGLVLLSSLLAEPLTDTQINLLYFFLNFVFAVAIFHRFLWESIKAAGASAYRCLRYALLGFGIYYAASLLVSQVIVSIYPDFFNVNDGAILDMSQENWGLMALATVILVPVAEECFHRGLIFGGLHRKNRALAYLVSVVVFAGIHVVGYIGQYDWLMLLLCFAQYLPAGLVLAWVYEKTDTIIAPILIHITINQIGMSAMR